MSEAPADGGGATQGANPSSDGGAGPVDGSPADAGQALPDANVFDVASGHVVVLYPASALDAGVDEAGISEWQRSSPVADAAAENLGAALDTLSRGEDSYVSVSRDGQWLALVTTRFGCQSGGCLAVARTDATGGGLVEATVGVEIGPTERPAVASGGSLVVYPAEGGPHGWDLYAVSRASSAWSAPRLLTAGMSGGSGEFAHNVGISYDAKTAVFECGPSQYQGSGADVCVTKVDGTGTSVAVSHLAGPSATSANYTHHPDYAPDGTVVFEADWVAGGGSEERIWRARPAAGAAALLTLLTPPGIGDDNSPCVLPDGRIASLWLPGSIHELKVMNADGSGAVLVETDVDVVDVGQSCGW